MFAIAHIFAFAFLNHSNVSKTQHVFNTLLFLMFKGDPARDLATVHHICESHLAELADISKDMSQIKTLVTVTEMLSKHKQKYTEMLSSSLNQGLGGGPS